MKANSYSTNVLDHHQSRRGAVKMEYVILLFMIAASVVLATQIFGDTVVKQLEVASLASMGQTEADSGRSESGRGNESGDNWDFGDRDEDSGRGEGGGRGDGGDRGDSGRGDSGRGDGGGRGRADENRGDETDSGEPLPPQPGGPLGPNSSGGYTIGPPSTPAITHDDGFTEFCANNPGHADCSGDASLSDYASRTKYEALLRGAQAAGHLDDGAEAYSHYLYGDGADWHFDYSEFINEDSNGRLAADNLLLDAQRHAEVIGQGRGEFSITGEPHVIGGGDPRFPYPSTENWQKAIGGHQVWTSSDVAVTTNADGERVYEMTITYHGEDRYNFNPGENDIGSGAADRDNGRFEVLGWADPFMSYGESQRTVTWTEGDIPNSQVGEDTPARRTDRGTDTRGEIGDR